MFDYKKSTLEELVNHVSVSSPAKISVAKRYHESKGNFEVVERIQQARNVIKQKKLMIQIKQLQESNKV